MSGRVACGAAGLPGAAGVLSGRAAGCSRGQGLPASRLRGELRSARWLVARPGPAVAHGHCSQASPPPVGTAVRPGRCPWALQSGPPVPPAPSTPVAPGVLACGLARRLVVRPCPATAHGHCSQASPPPSIPMVGVWQHEELSVSVQAACRGSNGAIPSIGGGQPAT